MSALHCLQASCSVLQSSQSVLDAVLLVEVCLRVHPESLKVGSGQDHGDVLNIKGFITYHSETVSWVNTDMTL